MAPPEATASWMFDLARGDLVTEDAPSLAAAPDTSRSHHPSFSLTTADDLPDAAMVQRLASVTIIFPVFSDGRGFTLARRLRTESGFTGRLIADGHIIPDQADYLFRCGFTHALVTKDRLADWQQARQFIQIHFQTMPKGRHSRLDPPSGA